MTVRIRPGPAAPAGPVERAAIMDVGARDLRLFGRPERGRL
ncbi:hypothetical protein M2324_002159 [Rhodovulum sulfidophilum]|nr:hypothetical protein [Rhodovulum sulfidophilum]MCW2303757.1 hypothetical protein [Rhodovulum sulfidophilum]